MMRSIAMILGTILAILFLIQLFRGQKYEELVEGLEEKDFPLKDIYTVGFCWAELPPLRLRGVLFERLEQNAKVLYGEMYAEYYANVYYAMALSFFHFILCFGCLLAGWQDSRNFFYLGIFLAIVGLIYGCDSMRQKLVKRTENCETELPAVVSTMAILVNSGMILRDAWNMVGGRGEGDIYALMRDASEDIRNGHADSEAIAKFGRATNSPEIIKFTSALMQSMGKGAGELPLFLARQSSDLWNEKKQRLLQKGEQASAKLLMPIMLIFLGIIIIILSSAFAGISL